MMNYKVKNTFIGCISLLVVVILLFGTVYYALFCFEVHQGNEYVAYTVKENEIDYNGNNTMFVFNSNKYSCLTDGYYYKIKNEDDLKLLGYMAYKGLIKKERRDEIYSIKSDTDNQFLYFNSHDLYTNSYIYYRYDFLLPDILPENIKEVELYDTDSGLLYGEQMQKIEPDYRCSDYDFIKLIISEFEKKDGAFVDFDVIKKILSNDSKYDLSNKSYYVCLTFKDYNENFCFLLGETI